MAPDRVNIRALLTRFGARLVEVHDRADFVGRLYRSAAWRAALLGVRGEALALGHQRRDGGKPVGGQLPELDVHEFRRSEDVGDPRAAPQHVQGRDVQRPRACIEVSDATSLIEDEAEARGDVAAQALRPRLGDHDTGDQVRRRRAVAAHGQRGGRRDGRQGPDSGARGRPRPRLSSALCSLLVYCTGPRRHLEGAGISGVDWSGRNRAVPHA